MSGRAAPIRIATRGSMLALAQSRQVADLLGGAHPGLAVAFLVALLIVSLLIRGVVDLARLFIQKD